MYTSIAIVYGSPLNLEQNRLLRAWAKAGDPRFADEEVESCGFTPLPGCDDHGYPLGYVGVRLGVLAAYPGNAMDFASFRAEPTEEERADYKRQRAALDPALRVLVGDPKVWLIPYES